MKKIFVSLSLMVALGLTTVHANDNFTVNDKIKESFKKEFAEATSVKWAKDQDFQTATFVFYDHLVVAYFDTDGTLLGSARDVLLYEVPMAVMKSFDKTFPGVDPLEVLEVSNTEGTFYRLTIDIQNKRYYVKIDAGGNISNIAKMKKIAKGN
jgi:hypothetical protein